MRALAPDGRFITTTNHCIACPFRDDTSGTRRPDDNSLSRPSQGRRIQFLPEGLRFLQWPDIAHQSEPGAVFAARNDLRRKRPDDVRPPEPAEPDADPLRTADRRRQLCAGPDGWRRDAYPHKLGNADPHA